MRIDTIDNKAFGVKAPSTEIKDTGLDLSTDDSPISLSSPFRNPYGNTSSNRTPIAKSAPSSGKGVTAAERNNNPFNIKFGKFASKYGATKENKAALDGGSFATFPTVDAGFRAAKDLLQGNGYRNLTVDAAMKRWSNNGYGGNIYPEIANKRIADLSSTELDNLQKKQIVREDRNYAKKLGIYKYGGYLPKMAIGGLTPQPYTTTANPLSTGLNKYTTQTALNNLIKDNTKKSAYTPPSVESSLNTGMLSAGLGVAGAALSTLDDNPRKVNQPVNVGSGILKGAAAGATMGSVIPGWGTAVGAVAGAAVGGVTSFIKGKKRQKLIDQSIENDQKNFNTIQQDRSRALYAQLNPYTYKYGGQIDDKKPIKPKTVQLEAATVKGKRQPIYVDNPNDPKLKAYNDSLRLYNQSKDIENPKYYDNHSGVPGASWYNWKGDMKSSNEFAKAHGQQGWEDNPKKFKGKIKPIATKYWGEGINLPIYKKPTQPVKLGRTRTQLPDIKEINSNNTISLNYPDIKIPELKQPIIKETEKRFDHTYYQNPNESNYNYDQRLKKLGIRKYKFGGAIQPEWEAEKDEVIQGNPILEEGKQIANGLHLVGGKTHENGGTKGAGEGRVFSNSIFFNGKTPATMVKNIGSKLKKFEPNLSSKDSMKRTTAEVMTKKLNDQIEEVFERQESFKQTPQFKFGGNLPKFAEGGDTVATKKKQIQDRIKTLDRYLSENTKRQALGGFDAKDKLRAERNQLQKQLDNPAIWTGKPFDPFAKTGNGKLPVKDISWTNDLDAVTIKGKREVPAANSARKTALPKIATRNNININSGTRTGRTDLVQNPNNPLAKINREVTPIAPVENNRSVASGSTSQPKRKLNIDPALATGLGLSAAGYLNTAANINRMNTDVPVNLTASPYYGYTDRSRLARHDLSAMGNTILRDPNVSSGRKQAIFARLSQGVNQINAQENSNRYAYDNEFNARQLEINTRNNAMLTQAQQQKIANQNAILGARSANFNSFMGNVTGVIAENEQRKLDERKMKIITDSYRRNYGTDFNVTANP